MSLAKQTQNWTELRQTDTQRIFSSTCSLYSRGRRHDWATKKLQLLLERRFNQLRAWLSSVFLDVFQFLNNCIIAEKILFQCSSSTNTRTVVHHNWPKTRWQELLSIYSSYLKPSSYLPVRYRTPGGFFRELETSSFEYLECFGAVPKLIGQQREPRRLRIIREIERLGRRQSSLSGRRSGSGDGGKRLFGRGHRRSPAASPS
nr:hypothetical protein Iba_chr08eCG9510 [Ipomoea batatas]